MNTVWYLKATTTLENTAHVHDMDEIEIWLRDEQHLLTRNCLLFVPTDLKHCPLILRRVDRTIFHITTITGKQYIKDVTG